MGELNAYSILVGKPDGKRPLGRCGCKRKYSFTVNLGEIGCEDVD
jgi:hypothetical protein